MTEEIKEILDDMKQIPIDESWALNLEDYQCKLLLNYITNLQKEKEEFYQLMEMQNKREYRSKFLKDFQKEHGKNVFPDYDEIYKRYDNYKQRNEKAIEYLKSLMDGETKKLYRTEDAFKNISKEQAAKNELVLSMIKTEMVLNILQGGDE